MGNEMLENEIQLRDKIDELNKTIDQKCYLAGGLMNIIIDSKNEDMIDKARLVLDESEKV